MRNPQELEQVITICNRLDTPTIIRVEDWVFCNEQITQKLNDLGFWVVYADFRAIREKDELLKTLDQVYEFPDYFGFNWDAVADSLKDFHWHPAKGYILMANLVDGHNDIFRSFFDIVNEAGDKWMTQGIPFKVLIPYQR